MPNGLRGARLGVARKFFGINAAMDQFMDRHCPLKGTGAELVDPADLPSHGKLREPEFEVLLYDFKAGSECLPGGFRRTRRGHRSLEDVIAFNEKHRREEMPYFGQELFERRRRRGQLRRRRTSRLWPDAVRLSRAEGIDAVISKYKGGGHYRPDFGSGPPE